VQHLTHFDVIGESAAPTEKAVLLLARQWLPYPVFLGNIRAHAFTLYFNAACRPSISF
jgi:hypothetical protein